MLYNWRGPSLLSQSMKEMDDRGAEEDNYYYLSAFKNGTILYYLMRKRAQIFGGSVFSALNWPEETFTHFFTRRDARWRGAVN